MMVIARMTDTLLKETASEVSKQTALSRGATGVQSAHLTADRLQHRQPCRACIPKRRCPAGHVVAAFLHPPGLATRSSGEKFPINLCVEVQLLCITCVGMLCMISLTKNTFYTFFIYLII